MVQAVCHRLLTAETLIQSRDIISQTEWHCDGIIWWTEWHCDRLLCLPLPVSFLHCPPSITAATWYKLSN